MRLVSPRCGARQLPPETSLLLRSRRRSRSLRLTDPARLASNDLSDRTFATTPRPGSRARAAPTPWLIPPPLVGLPVRSVRPSTSGTVRLRFGPSSRRSRTTLHSPIPSLGTCKPREARWNGAARASRSALRWDDRSAAEVASYFAPPSQLAHYRNVRDRGTGAPSDARRGRMRLRVDRPRRGRRSPPCRIDLRPTPPTEPGQVMMILSSVTSHPTRRTRRMASRRFTREKKGSSSTRAPFFLVPMQ